MFLSVSSGLFQKGLSASLAELHKFPEAGEKETGECPKQHPLISMAEDVYDMEVDKRRQSLSDSVRERNKLSAGRAFPLSDFPEAD